MLACHVVDDPLLRKNGGLREIFAPVHTPKEKGKGRGERGVVKVETENSQLQIRNCPMSIMAFGFPIMEMNFALSEFEFKVFTLEIDFQFRIFTFGNRFSTLNFHF